MENLNLTELKNFIQAHRKLKPVSKKIRGLDKLNSTLSSNCVDVKTETVAQSVKDIEFREMNLSSGELIDLVSDLEKSGSDIKTGSNEIIDRIRMFTEGTTKAVSDSSKRFEKTHFKALSEKYINSYTHSFDQVLNILNNKDASTLTIDSQHLEPMSTELKESYENFMELIAKLEASYIDDEGKMSDNDDNIHSAILLQIKEEEQKMKKYLSDVRASTNVAGAFNKLSLERSQELVNAYENNMARLNMSISQFKSGRFWGASSSFRGIFSPDKKAKKMNDAQSRVYSHMNKLTGALNSLGFLEIIIKFVKQLIGYLMGINNHAAEFNKDLLRHHGLVSQGIVISPGMENSDTVKQQYNVYHDRLASFAWDSKTFVTDRQIMEITDAFEKQGMRFHQMASDDRTMQAYINTTLRAKAVLGMGLDESANHIAEWHHQMGMDLEQVSYLVDRLGMVTGSTGYPVRYFLEALKNVNSDYGMTVDRLDTVLELNRIGQEKGRLTAKANYDSVNTLLAHLKSMDAKNFAKLTEPLLMSGRFAEIVQDEIDRYKAIEGSGTSDRQISQAQYSRKVLERAMALGDPFFLRRAMQAHSGEQNLLRLYKEGLEAQIGADFKKGLDQGILGKDTEVLFQALVGFSGDRGTIELFKEATHLVFNAPILFSENSVHGKLSKELIQNQKKSTELNETHMSFIKHNTLSNETREAILNKWMTKITSSFNFSLGGLISLWSSKLFGGLSAEQKKELQTGIDQLRNLMSRVPVAQDKKSKDRLLKAMETRIKSLKDMGADMHAVIAELLNANTDSEVRELFNKYAPSGGVLDSAEGGNPNIANTIEGLDYDAELAERLMANYRKGMASAYATYKSSVGHCLAGIRYTFDHAGVQDIQVAWASKAGPFMERHPNFQEVAIHSDEDMMNAPIGTIYIWGRSPRSGHPYGHISMKIGPGKEVSDHVATLRPRGPYGDHVFRRMFVPVKSKSTGVFSPTQSGTPNTNASKPSTQSPDTNGSSNTTVNKNKKCTNVTGTIPKACNTTRRKVNAAGG